MPQSNSLFTNGVAAWEAEPRIAFDAWLVKEGIGESSSKVYRALWWRYVDWAGQRRFRLGSMTREQIEVFLDSLQVRRQQRERSHRLIERVMDDMHSRAPGADNAARMAKTLRGMGWRDTEGNEPTGFLSDALREAIIDYGTAQHPQADCAQGADAALWRKLRNRAIVGTFLGGGLKLAELRGLTVNCVNFRHGPWIRARPARQPMRQVRLPAYALDWIEAWLQTRQACGTSGAWLFPGDVRGGRISGATVSRLVNTFVAQAAAGLPAHEPVTAQTLRNDFVGRLLQAGVSHAEVAERAGFADEISVARLEVALQAWSRQSGAHATPPAA